MQEFITQPCLEDPCRAKTPPIDHTAGKPPVIKRSGLPIGVSFLSSRFLFFWLLTRQMSCQGIHPADQNFGPPSEVVPASFQPVFAPLILSMQSIDLSRAAPGIISPSA